jgi:hypothetical protein
MSTALTVGLTVGKKMIAQRQRYVEKVIGFVHKLLTAKGTVLQQETHSSHHYALRELKFEGFTFTDEGSFTMFGGDEVTILYKSWLVFKAKYHDIKEVEVEQFDITMSCPDWRTPLNKLMHLGVPRIAAKIDSEQKRADTQFLKNMQTDTVQKQLRKEMERLRLVV